MSGRAAESPLRHIKILGGGDGAVTSLVIISTVSFAIVLIGILLLRVDIVNDFTGNAEAAIQAEYTWARNVCLVVLVAVCLYCVANIYNIRITAYKEAQEAEVEDCLSILEDWVPTQLKLWSAEAPPPKLKFNLFLSSACRSTTNSDGTPAIVVGTGFTELSEPEARFLLAHEFSHCEIERDHWIHRFSIFKDIETSHAIRTLIYFSAALAAFGSVAILVMFSFFGRIDLFAYGTAIAVLAIVPLSANIILTYLVLVNYEFLHDLRAAQLTQDRETGIEMLRASDNKPKGIVRNIKGALQAFRKFHPTNGARIRRLREGNFLHFDIFYLPMICGASLLLPACSMGVALFASKKYLLFFGISFVIGTIYVTVFAIQLRSHFVYISLKIKEDLRHRNLLNSTVPSILRTFAYSACLWIGFVVPFFLIFLFLKGPMDRDKPSSAQDIFEAALKLAKQSISMTVCLSCFLLIIVAIIIFRADRRSPVLLKCLEVTTISILFVVLLVINYSPTVITVQKDLIFCLVCIAIGCLSKIIYYKLLKPVDAPAVHWNVDLTR